MSIIDKLKQIVGIQPKEQPKKERQIDNSKEKRKAIEQAYKKLKKK